MIHCYRMKKLVNVSLFTMELSKSLSHYGIGSFVIKIFHVQETMSEKGGTTWILI